MYQTVTSKCLPWCAGVLLASLALAQAPEGRFAGVGARPVGPVSSIGGISFIAPEGWQVTQQGQATVLVGPVRGDLQPCMIVIDPTVPVPDGDPGSEAQALVNAAFAGRFGPYHGAMGIGADGRARLTEPKSDQMQGVSATGWSYVDLFGQLGNSNAYVRTILAQYGTHAVVLMGLTRAVDCLGSSYLRENDKFLLLFHSLEMPGFTQEKDHLAKRIVGSWQSVSGNAGVGLIFAANGHYDNVGATGAYYATNTGQLIYETHSTWPGSGSYQIAGDRLRMTRNGSHEPQTKLFSIVRHTKPDGSPEDVLRIVEASSTEVWGFGHSGHYVIDYRRTQ